MASAQNSKSHEEGRTVYLPLPSIDVCNTCQKKAEEAKLRVCTACGEALYCSTECQRKDWKSHKIHCGETDRIDLQSFYPFLAYIAQLTREIDGQEHPALKHKIVDSPRYNPNLGPEGFPSPIVVLGPAVDEESAPPSQGWWPAEPALNKRCKLAERIISEGYLLPNLLSICIALVAEIYTTTALRADTEPDVSQFSGSRRVRMSHDRSPIADFGIDHGCVGAVVADEDRLAYFLEDQGTFIMGQMPEDHYRIYFRTLAGNEYWLELGMFTFNFGIKVDSTPYSAVKERLPTLGFVPAFFPPRDMVKTGQDEMVFKRQNRFSVLRDPRVHAIIRRSAIAVDMDEDDWDIGSQPLIFEIMDDIAGRPCTESERMRMVTFLLPVVELVRWNVEDRDYIRFPETPQVAIHTDADGHGVTDDEEAMDECEKFWKKQAKRLKKGKSTKEQWEREARDTWGPKMSKLRQDKE